MWHIHTHALLAPADLLITASTGCEHGTSVHATHIRITERGNNQLYPAVIGKSLSASPTHRLAVIVYHKMLNTKVRKGTLAVTQTASATYHNK